MSKQRQFLRQTAAVLLAFGLIASLLPGCAAAEDGPAPPRDAYEIPTFQPEPELEARRQFVIEQVAALELPAPNTQRYRGTAILKAKLQVNPNDAAALQRASEFWGTPENPWPGDRWTPAGKANLFTQPGIAAIFAKHWDNFTPAQRANMRQMAKQAMKRYLGHGTENHMLKETIPAYIFAELWPDDDGWPGDLSSAEVRQIAKARLLHVVNGYLDKNHGEFISQNYFHTNLYPWHALYDCAQDPELKYAAYVALCYHYTAFAANNFRGLAIGPFPRGQLQPTTGAAGYSALTWFWAGPDFSAYVPTTSGDLSITGGQSRPAMAVAVAIGDFVMPPAILSLWRGETGPYELTTSAPGTGNNNSTPWMWLTGEPGGKNRYIYRHPDYAIGSGFTEFYPDEFHMQDHSAVNILYRSDKNWAFIDTQHHYWRSNTREWGFGNNSPFCQMAQHKSAAIAIFNIPETDPWPRRGRPDWLAQRDQHYDNLIKEVFVRYPKSIDEVVEEAGWVFLREGGVYIAIRPLRKYTIENNPIGTAVGGEVATNFNAIRTTSAQTGFVYDVATGAEFASFAAFREKAIQNPPSVDWDKLSVTYTSLAGDTITARWNPPNYSGPPVTNWIFPSWRQWNNASGSPSITAELRNGNVTGGFDWDNVNRNWIGPQGDKWYPGSRVLVRPHITINGTVLPPPREYTPDSRPGQDPADFDYYIPMKSPNANIGKGVLSVQTPGGDLTVYAPRKK
jgi:hypothetical protein